MTGTHPHPTAKREASALSLSAFANLGMAAAGFTFAALAGSEALLLDGVYSLLAFIMLLLVRRVARLVHEPDSERFQFGFARFEPMMNVVRGLLILVVLLFALGSAAIAIAAGGREIVTGLALLYCGIIGLACFCLAFLQRRAAHSTGSPTLHLDAANWFADGIITAGIAAVFVAAKAIEGTSLAWLIPYVDPAIVLVLGLALLWMPYRILRVNLAQLLDEASDSELQRQAHTRLETAVSGLPLRARHIRMLLVGRVAYLLATLVVDDGGAETSVSDLDRIRAEIATQLRDLHPHMYIDILFVADERWVEGRV